MTTNDLFSLEGKTALITGASRGIGRACALALADAGANIVLVLRPPPTSSSSPPSDPNAVSSVPVDQQQASDSTFNTLNARGGKTSVSVVHCNLDDLEAVKTIFARALRTEAAGGTKDKDGEIHVLVNCAGIQRRAPCVEFSETDWDDVLNVNLKSVWLLSQAAGRHMVPLKRGKIINFCSLLTFQGGFTVPAYAAAKGALGQLTKALSNEWSRHNVNVNGICPGYIETDMNTALLNNPTRLQQINDRIPAGRWGTPEDFAGPVVFLASKASDYVCGELVVVDGGWMGR
ncbi:NAD(P)-binding protein [Dendrothele bispora CBS 962.96]|uniref:NAD(P)-binding protein n=1 Tax=Dendrothele bispora (strain CBS 962.96) TaxID=1314807 RepID=A0A4S8KUW1_DENBC|nr:NAD(P)-binding protein [Dendrothele bispora CBS 962.96]